MAALLNRASNQCNVGLAYIPNLADFNTKMTALLTARPSLTKCSFGTYIFLSEIMDCFNELLSIDYDGDGFPYLKCTNLPSCSAGYTTGASIPVPTCTLQPTGVPTAVTDAMTMFGGLLGVQAQENHHCTTDVPQYPGCLTYPSACNCLVNPTCSTAPTQIPLTPTAGGLDVCDAGGNP
jgi:hypothetical protein